MEWQGNGYGFEVVNSRIICSIRRSHGLVWPDDGLNNVLKLVVGFTVQEIGAPGWRMLMRDGCRIMLGQCRDAKPASSRQRISQC